MVFHSIFAAVFKETLRQDKQINDKMEKLKERKWKVLESTYLHRRPWLTVRRERVELPNGNQVPEYYVLEYPDWINVIAITKEGKFVFISQYRHGLGKTLYEICAGVCEKEDASPLVSAQRELYEETGFGGGSWREYMVISPNPGSQSNLTHCFLAEGVEPVSTQHLEASEDIRVHILTTDEVLELLKTDQIKQATHVAPLWKYVAEHHLI